MTDTPRQDKTARRKRVRLPFENRRISWSEWVYIHRTGLCTTVILYLVCAIIFVSSQIIIDKRPGDNAAFIIDFGELSKLEEEKNRLQEEVDKQIRQMYDDYSDVKNAKSNLNAKELDPSLRDDRGTNAKELYSRQTNVQNDFASNRQLYEEGLAEEKSILEGQKGEEGPAAEQPAAKVRGRVTVEYSLTNPVRNHTKLVVPAYRCEGGGEVVVNITVNHNGNVIAAEVDRSRSTSDYCMTTTAISAARQSRFNVDTSAPERHTGTISYIFIPQ